MSDDELPTKASEVRRTRPVPGYLVRRPARSRVRERYPRQRRQVSIEELLAQFLRRHKLTDAVREQCIFVFWRDIVGPSVGRITQPEAIHRGVLRIAAKTSVQIQELQFHRAKIVQQINAWIVARKKWLGDAPIVTDVRFAIGTVRPISDAEQLDRQRQRHVLRLRPERPPASETDRIAIRADVSCVEDPELRALIEGVRLRANL